MAELSGVFALVLIFLSGPYRTLQKRFRPGWGPVLSVWAHGNVSLAAAVAVFVHLLLAGELELSLEPSSIDGLTWIATVLFATSVFSGLFGLYVATGPTARRRWLTFHRGLTSVFYLAVIPHVVSEGVIRWPVFALLLAAWGISAGRRRMPPTLSRLRWPLSGRRGEQSLVRPARRSKMRVLSSAAAVALLAAAAALLVVHKPAEKREAEVEIYGRISEVADGLFTLQTRQGAVRVKLSRDTEIEDGRDLVTLQRQQTIVEVEGVRRSDGTVLAAEVEVGGQEYSD